MGDLPSCGCVTTRTERKARREVHKNVKCCCKEIPEATPHKNNCMGTYLSSHISSKYNEYDILGTTGEVKTNS